MPKTARSRAKTSKPEQPAGDTELSDTQRRILTAALEVFSERGYAGASTAEIAARAQVAEKTLFAQFKSKSELLARTLRPSVFLLVEPRAIDRVRDAVSPRGKSLEQVLGALMADRLDLAKKHRKKLKLVAHETLLRPDFLANFSPTFKQRVAPAVLEAMTDLTARGQIRTDLPPQTLVRTLVSVIVGYAISRYVLGFESELDDEREVANVVNLITEGLRPRSEAQRRKPPKRAQATRPSPAAIRARKRA